MRVYLPTTLPALRDAAASGAVGPAPVTAYAVTPQLREWYASADAEELEYAATVIAARASLRLLARAPEAARRRVVLAADVDDRLLSPAPDLHRAAVLVAEPIAMSDVASVHVDDPADAEVIQVAAASVLAADAGDEDARFAVDDADAVELQWYAAQELPALLEGGPADS